MQVRYQLRHRPESTVSSTTRLGYYNCGRHRGDHVVTDKYNPSDVSHARRGGASYVENRVKRFGRTLDSHFEALNKDVTGRVRSTNFFKIDLLVVASV